MNNEFVGIINQDILIGRRVIDLVESAGISRMVIHDLVNTIKTYYKVGAVSSFLTNMWVPLNAYQQKMVYESHLVSIEEFIGHACNAQGSSLKAFEEYKVRQGGDARLFKILISAMLQVSTRSNLFLGNEEAIRYRLIIKTERVKNIENSRDFAKNDKNVFHRKAEDVFENYNKIHSSRKNRKIIFFSLAEHVAKTLAENEPIRFGVQAHRAAHDLDVGSVRPENVVGTWSILVPTIRRLLAGYNKHYFLDPEQWPENAKRDFIQRVYSKNLPVAGSTIVGDQRSNMKDEDVYEDPDSNSLKDVFISPDEYVKKIQIKAEAKLEEDLVPDDSIGTSRSTPS